MGVGNAWGHWVCPLAWMSNSTRNRAKGRKEGWKWSFGGEEEEEKCLPTIQISLEYPDFCLSIQVSRFLTKNPENDPTSYMQ